MEKCKTIEAKIDFLKTLFEKLTLILLALGGGFGTLLVKYQYFLSLLLITFITLLVIFLTLIFVIYLWRKELNKLNSCKEEEK
jgi:hypothetical protein